MSALAHLTAHGLQVLVQEEKLIVSPRERLTDDLRVWIKQHKHELMQELQSRLHPEMAADGYVWCVDCQHFNKTCTHSENPFRNQRPLVPRKCQWYTKSNRGKS